MPARIGLYLGVVQFFFAATWVVYVIYLPQLAARAGFGKGAVAAILMADQLVFVFADYATGVFSDRVARIVGRLGWLALAATIVSCAAFLALPFIAPAGAPAAFIALIAVWAVTSSALRAPPLALIGKHAAKPAQPTLVALSVLGLGVANAAAPFLGLVLRGVDPRLPFVLASASLAAVTLGLVAAERQLAGSRPENAASTAVDQAAAPPAPTPFVLLAVGVAALAFQAHVFIDSGPLYLRHAAVTDLPLLAPTFWVGFNLALLPFTLLARHWATTRIMVAATILAALAAASARYAPSLSLLVAAQFIAGAGWAGALAAAFAWATGRRGKAGTYAGALSSLLALATLIRMGSVAAGWPQAPDLRDMIAWWPAAGWLIASAVLFAGWHWHASRQAGARVPA